MKLSLFTVKKIETYLNGYEWETKSIYYLFGFIPLASNVKTFPYRNIEKEYQIKKSGTGILNDFQWSLFGLPIFRLETTHISKRKKHVKTETGDALSIKKVL
jgi:hypothetical protein